MKRDSTDFLVTIKCDMLLQNVSQKKYVKSVKKTNHKKFMNVTMKKVKLQSVGVFRYSFVDC